MPPSVDIVVSLQGQLQPSYNVNGQTMTQQDFLTYKFGSVFNLAGRVTFKYLWHIYIQYYYYDVSLSAILLNNCYNFVSSVTAFPAPGNNTVSVYLTMLSDPVKGKMMN